MPPVAATLALLAHLVPTASAQQSSAERPPLPAWTLAGDDGASAMWRNPANLGFDPDPGFALLYAQSFGRSAPTGFSAAINQGPLATGLRYAGDAGGSTWWTLSSGLGLRLDRDLSLGVHFGWQLPAGADNNFTTWDLGVGYRPLPWLGLAAVAQNLGGTGAERGVEERFGGGAVFRPWGDAAMLGIDYLMTGEGGSAPAGVAQGSLRVRPTSGLVLRAYGDSDGTFGGGVEVYLGGAGVGLFGAGAGSGDPLALGYVRSSEPGERLIGGNKRVTEFTFDAPYAYQPIDTIFTAPSESYLHLLRRLRAAVDDTSVHGLLLHLDQAPFSQAQIEEIRGILKDGRDHGKPIVAYLDRATSGSAYLLASAADRVYLHPAGDIDLVGLSAEVQSLRGSFDLLGVEPQFARRSEYKSAAEGYTNSEASPANREQMNALLDDLYERLVAGIAEGRGKTPEAVRALIDVGPFTATEALERGLVDGLAYPDELERELERVYVEGATIDDAWHLDDGVRGWPAPQEVAVVYVEGLIVSGSSATPGIFGGGRTAGSDTIVRQLDQARRDSSVKAVILRVDSPGGSAFASDEIWRAAQRVQIEKPVVVSMGGVAASGGYYVSAGATAIYALPSTITGSIGVLGGKFSLGGLYDKVGLEVELFNRGRNAAMYSLSKPMDPIEFAALDRMIEETYRQFKEKVEQGRGMDAETVERVARGRVWSGLDSLDQGLVDELGGFEAALARAREEAGIPARARVELVTYSDRAGPDGEMFRQSVRALIPRMALANPAAAAAAMPGTELLVRQLELLGQWQALADDPVWAVLPYHLDVR